MKRRKLAVMSLLIVTLTGLTDLANSKGTALTNQNDAPKDMVLVPAGEFIMGSDARNSDEKPAHRVYLDAFYIDKFEVTNVQYQQCVSSGKCSQSYSDDGTCCVIEGGLMKQGTLPQSFREYNQPVVCVDWSLATAYCSYAGKRLPTEAEWEKAARGTDGRTYPWGEGLDCEKANYRDCKKGKTTPVGSYPSGASPYGAMDMAGNVWEWTADWYDFNYYKTSPNRNPTGPGSETARVLRGGSWDSYPKYVRALHRSSLDPSFRYNDYGFRCAKSP